VDRGDARDRLLAEQTRLEAIRVTESPETNESPEPASYDQHTADLGTDTFDRERDLSVLEQVEAELADVEHALARLDDGTYGTCEACGKTIPDERLEAMPATRFCLADQAEAEREAAARPSDG